MSLLKLLKHLLLDQFMFYGGGGKGGGGGSAPSYPDPNTVANATTATNTQTAAYNKALNLNNYSNPFGSQQTTATGTDPQTGAPTYNTSVNANPQLQGLFNSALGQAGNSAGINANSIAGIGDLNQQYGNLNNQLQGLKGNYASNNGQLQNLMGQNSNINQNLNGLNSQYQGLNSNIGALGGQYAGLQGQLGNIGASIDPNAGKAAQQQGQDAAYAAQKQYLDPQFSQQGESMNASLANQGLAPGSQAYNNAQTNFANQKQQAYSNASNQAVMTGSQIGAQSLNNQLNTASSRAGLVGQQGSMVGSQAGLFGLQGNNLGAQGSIYGQQSNNLGQQIGALGQQSANTAATAGLYGQQGSNLGQQASMYGQQNSLAQQPYSNLGSIGSMIPGYTGTGQSNAAPADISSLYNNQYQSQLAGYNAGQSSSNSMMSGLFGLGSSAMMAYGMSDRRAKRAIKRVAMFPNGLGVYTYRYMWEKAGVRHIGFMADEVRKIAPRAVLRFADGFDRVNYQLAAA
jgi:hypothetical protein